LVSVYCVTSRLSGNVPKTVVVTGRGSFLFIRHASIENNISVRKQRARNLNIMHAPVKGCD
jgi:hypothetical protein